MKILRVRITKNEPAFFQLKVYGFGQFTIVTLLAKYTPISLRVGALERIWRKLKTRTILVAAILCNPLRILL